MKLPKMLITGAASGLGRQIALNAAGAYELCLIDKSKEVEAIAERLNADYRIVDLSDVGALDELKELASNTDILVNNAGIASKKPFDSYRSEEIKSHLNVNVLAPALLTNWMLRSGPKSSKSIVNICSSAAYFPAVGMGTYSASKAFLAMFSNCLIGEYSDEGVNVLSILPSGIDTNFQQTSGVKNDNPRALLDPNVLSKEILLLIKKDRSVVKMKGLSTVVLKFLSGVLPTRLYIGLVRWIFNKVR